MTLQPPLIPALGVKGECNYGVNEVDQCRKVALWHVIWNPDHQESEVCEDHLEAVKSYAYFGLHRIEAPCHSATSAYNESEDRCEETDPVLKMALSSVVAA